MRETKNLLFPSDFPKIRRQCSDTLQVNLGYRCNQSCVHCHVNAGPTRSEMMDSENMAVLFEVISSGQFKLLDLTGGAPELHPQFQQLVQHARQAGLTVRDRCNLTILFEPGQEKLATFLADHQVEIVASLPCYSELNVDLQRGKGVFSKSIEALKLLNSLGYGTNSEHRLHLVYNPAGAVLPPPQATLELDYKTQLAEKFSIKFDQLFVITNMPIKRFGSTLAAQGNFHSYLETLKSAYQSDNIDGVMCRDTVSVDWQGYLYDCDFNQMLEMPLENADRSKKHLRELLEKSLDNAEIMIGQHCYGCTAGQGSSCSGALSETNLNK
jgi:radical SAM/Cys-rich protein